LLRATFGYVRFLTMSRRFWIGSFQNRSDRGFTLDRHVQPDQTGGTVTNARREMSQYDPDNIFARILRGEIPSEQVYENAETLVFMDIMPRADGHILVIPKTPCRNVLDASPAQLTAVITTVQKMAQTVMTAFDAPGVTIQQFNEAAGGQEVFHLHFHILPRHEGVKLRPPGQMEERDVLQANAARIRAALS